VADDWDLVLRSLRLGPVVLLDDLRVGYRRHDSNTSSGTDRNIRETRQVWARTYFSPDNGVARRSRLRRIWRAHQRRTARTKISAGLRAVRHGDLVTGALAGLDGIAHLLLLRPLRRWAKDARPPESHHPRRAEVRLRRKAKAATSMPSRAQTPPAHSGH
jgi:alpha-1,3-rhamnosyltransferase